MKRKNCFRRTKGRRRSAKVAVFLLGAFSLLSIGTWVSGELSLDPFEDTPLYLHEGALRFQDFRPELDQIEAGRYVSRFENGVTASYTIDADIQLSVQSYFEKYDVPYGAFVAIAPKTGKVLALVDHSTRDPDAKDLSLRATYPAASIFKVVTAAAAVEKKKIAPGTTIRYRGNFNRLRPAYWRDNPKKDKLKMSLANAFAQSNNVIFAKVATRWLDTPTLISYGTNFRFNRPIPFELPVEVSRIEMDETESALAKTAAGFGAVGLSPLHAALLGSAIANDGVMMSPCMVDFVTNPLGEKIYECLPKALNKSVFPETASALRDMMGLTVKRGTVREIFRRRRLERSLRKIKIGGKTGSLRGKNPRGRYSWFVGMAPLEDPEIVVAAMVVNDPMWRIVAAQVAKEGLGAYFKSQQAIKKRTAQN